MTGVPQKSGIRTVTNEKLEELLWDPYNFNKNAISVITKYDKVIILHSKLPPKNI